MVSQGNQGEVQVFPEGWVFLFCGRLLADALKQPGVNRPPDNNRRRHVIANVVKRLAPFVGTVPFPAMARGKEGGQGNEEGCDHYCNAALGGRRERAKGPVSA